MRVLVTRPEEDAEATSAALATIGVEAVPAPLLAIRNLEGPALDLSGVQALLFTSANGVRAFQARSDSRDVKALCVGDASARAATAAGFANVLSASGDVEALFRLAKKECTPKDGALLHAAGTKVAGDLGGMLTRAGFAYRREVLYEAEKADRLPDAARAALTEGTINGVLLFSPRTATQFAGLVKAEKLTGFLERVAAYCLSPAVAEGIKDLPWQTVRVAAHPDQASLLALLGAEE